MKTTLELPDELMRALKVQAAAYDRKLKDVVADVMARGLGNLVAESTRLAVSPAGAAVVETRPLPEPERMEGVQLRRDDLEALFAAGDDLVRKGVNVAEWAAHSRDVWR